MTVYIFTTPQGDLIPQQAWYRSVAIQLLYSGRIADVDSLAVLLGWGQRRFYQPQNGLAPPRWAVYEGSTSYNVLLCGVNNAIQYPPIAAGYIGIPATEAPRINVFFNNMVANFISPNLLPLIPDGTKTLTFFGHSYGGAIAQVMAWRLSLTNPARPIAFCSIGQPRVYTQGGTSPAFDSARIAFVPDPVCHLPPAGGQGLLLLPGPFTFLSVVPTWRHYSPGFSILTSGVIDTYNNFFEDPLSVAVNLSASNVSFHDSAAYQAALYQALTPTQRQAPNVVQTLAILQGGSQLPNPVGNANPPAGLGPTAVQVEDWFGTGAGIVTDLASTAWYTVAMGSGVSPSSPQQPGLVPPFQDFPTLPNPTLPTNPVMNVHPNVVRDP